MGDDDDLPVDELPPRVSRVPDAIRPAVPARKPKGWRFAGSAIVIGTVMAGVLVWTHVPGDRVGRTVARPTEPPADAPVPFRLPQAPEPTVAMAIATSLARSPEPHTTLPRGRPTPAPTSTVAQGDDRLSGCIIAADDACVIALLGSGRAHGVVQLRVLFDAQRSVGDVDGACATADRLALTSSGAQFRTYRETACSPTTGTRLDSF